mmetsp:Transcript_8823/g.22197  ORF Transcript_8823/g.22197 Transcript_8823/m.22197 type:complete len:122 (-) Transcript_8823:125-490(-)
MHTYETTDKLFVFFWNLLRRDDDRTPTRLQITTVDTFVIPRKLQQTLEVHCCLCVALWQSRPAKLYWIDGALVPSCGNNNTSQGTQIASIEIDSCFTCARSIDGTALKYRVQSSIDMSRRC